MIITNKGKYLLFVVVLLICYAVNGIWQRRDGDCDMKNNFTQIKEKPTPLARADTENYPDSVINYFKFYGLDKSHILQVEDEIPHENLRNKNILSEFFKVPPIGGSDQDNILISRDLFYKND